MQKLKAAGTPLGHYVGGKFYRGVTTGFNDAFVITTEQKDALIAEDPRSAEVIKPFLRGRDVKRYEIVNPGLWLLFIPWHFPLHHDTTVTGASAKAEAAFKRDYPAVYNHLLGFYDQLSARNRTETGIRYEWYALQRCAATYYAEFEKEKILVPVIQLDASFCYDTQKHFVLDTTYIIPLNDKYLLGILNSRVFWFLITHACNAIQNGYYKIQIAVLVTLPIPAATPEQKRAVEGLVERVLAGRAAGEDTSVVEREIDVLVYKLYKLSYEEVLVIEPDFPVTVAEYAGLEV